MKKYPLLFLLFIVIGTYGQEPVYFKENIRKGIYLSFDEFRSNRPSVTDSFELPFKDYGNPSIIKSNGTKSILKNYWGYSDGQNFFIHYDGENYLLEKTGRYSIFETTEASDTSEEQILDKTFLIDSKDGDIQKATEKNILSLLNDDPQLYKDYRKKGSRGLVYQYVDRYNRRHQIAYPFITELEMVENKKVKGKIFPNGVYLETFGNSIMLASANYERLSFTSGNFRMYGRVGLGYARWDMKNLISLPVGISGIIQLNKILGIEISAGTSIIYMIWKQNLNSVPGTYRKDDYDLLVTGNAGIRAQYPDGFFFRAGFVPIFDFKTDEPVMAHKFTPWFQVSVGYSFKD